MGLDKLRASTAFLNSLILFPPVDTASNLDPDDPGKSGFPHFEIGSIKLTVLFNDRRDLASGALRLSNLGCNGVTDTSPAEEFRRFISQRSQW